MRLSAQSAWPRRSTRGALCVISAVVALCASWSGSVLTTDTSGFVTIATVQTIGMSAGWGGLCPISDLNGRCYAPSGFALDSSTDQVLMTSTTSYLENDLGPGDLGHNYSIVFQPGSVTGFSSTNLSCAPYDPYYPGSGTVYYAACDPPNTSSNSGSLITVNVATDQVVGRIPFQGSTPDAGFWASGYPDQFAWDPVDHLLYVCDAGSLLAFNMTTGLASFNETIPSGCEWLVYDSSSNALLVSGSTALYTVGPSLVAVDPRTGTVENTVLSGIVTAAVLDANAGWIGLGVALNGPYSAGAIEFVNSTTYRPFATVPLIPPVQDVDTAPSQLVLDSTHGDIYAICLGWVFAINDTGKYSVGETTIAPSLNDMPSIYLESTRSLYIPVEGLVSYVAFSYGTTTEVTSLLWLPLPQAVLMLGVLAGAGAATTFYLRLSRRRVR